MKKQMIKIAMMLVMVIGAAASATAQGLASAGNYTGVETAAGTCEAITANCYGNAFVLTSFGEWETYHLSVSLNHVNIPNHDGSGMGVIGGSWSLVYSEGSYAGTLYGEVMDGSLDISEGAKGKPALKQLQARLISTGGSGMFAGEDGKNIYGKLLVISDIGTKETSGTVGFSF